MHLKELGERSTLFLWKRTRDGKDLTELGLTPEIVYPGEALVAGYDRHSISLIPNELVASNPTRALHGPTATGYLDLADAITQTVDHVEDHDSTYTHIYWKNIDKAAHETRTGSNETASQVSALEAGLTRLRSELPDDARIVVTGDHGHSDIPDELKFAIAVDDELQGYFESTPSGDNRTQIFRVAPKNHRKFVELFQSRFGEHFFLFSSKEVAELELLSPDGISDLTLGRLGDFMAIAKGRAVMKFQTPEDQRPIAEQSEHGGFSPLEMLVPVVIS